MAINFDGTVFVGLDDTGFGDGETDANTRFLSTGKERRLDANARYLWRQGYTIGYTPVMRADTSTGKPHLSVEPTTYCIIPWFIDPTDNSITIRFLARIDDEAATDAAQMTAKLQLGALEAEVDLGEADNSVHSITLDGLDVATPDYYPLVLWLQSTGAESYVSTGTDPVVNNLADTIDADSATPNVSADVTDTTILYVADGLTGTVPVTPLHKQQTTNIVPVSYDVGLVNFPGSSPGFDVYEASYIRILAIDIEVRRDPDKVGSDLWHPKGPSEMFALQPVLGQHTGQHGVNADGIYQAPRCVLIGPKGTQRPESTWPADYHARWSYAWGDTGGTLLDGVAKLDRESSRLDIRGFLAPAHLVSIYAGTDLDRLREHAARASWNVTATIEQIGVGETWASAGIEVASATQAISLKHFPTARSSRWPLLQQLWWAYFSDGEGKAGEALQLHLA